MRYELIDEELVQEIIDGIHPRKTVDDIEGTMGEWSGFLTTIIDYVKRVIDELKTFISGD